MNSPNKRGVKREAEVRNNAATNHKKQKKKNRKYDESYLKYGFSFIKYGAYQRPQCVLCYKVLANDSMVPAKLMRHLVTNHPGSKDESLDFFQLMNAKKTVELETMLVSSESSLEMDNDIYSSPNMENLFIVENFIDGKFVASCSKLLNSFEPATGKVWAKIPDSGTVEVDAAVAAAVKSFPAWSALSSEKRASYMNRVADLLEKRLDEFAEAESRDQGKPVWLAKKVDIPRAVKNFRHFAQTIPHSLETSKMLTDFNVLSYTIRSPIGVAGLISPWNLPLYLLTFKLAPALMCGNTVVAKPSEMTSVTAYKLCKLFQEAGLPNGVVNVVYGLGPSVGAALVRHPDVPLLSFTGSTVTGKSIAVAGSPLFKKLSLEMGGKNAAVLFNDCNLESAYETLLRSSFINQGHVCLCTSRIFVQRGIYDTFISKFVEKARNLKVGDPKDDDNFLGALNSLPHLEKVRNYVKVAIEDGGTVHCGETVDTIELKEKNKNGYFMRPTVISELADDSRCMQEEIFGPVTCVTPFDTEEEVIERVNGTQFGLCASVFTSNVGTAHRVAHALKVGTVWTNCWMVRDIDLPFGGVKGSGIGREGTKDSYEFYTEVKSVCTNFE